jgi:hypothetical protein
MSGVNVSEELLALEKEGWRAVTTGEAAVFAERMLAGDMMLVLPGMVLDRAEVVGLWLEAVPWEQFDIECDIEGASVIPLTPGGAVLTYRVTLSRRCDVTTYRAQCTTVYRRMSRRWRLVFHQLTPHSPARADGAPDTAPGEGRSGDRWPVGGG